MPVVRCGFCGEKTKGESEACRGHEDLLDPPPTRDLRTRGARRGMGAVADERRRVRGAWRSEQMRAEFYPE